MTVYPNAKINIGLHVLRKRPDGYHDLQTLFVPFFGLRDTLEITPAADALHGTPAADGKVGIEIKGACVDWDVTCDLTVRAYEILDREFGLPAVNITLVKQIPVGAGLGGGSSDAAFALAALSQMFSLGLTDRQLAERGSQLGSDCAFFIYNRPMLGSGRGEILEPFDIDLSEYDIRVEKPEGVSVSTREAYGGVVPRFSPSDEGLTDGLEGSLILPVEMWRGVVGNDFEKSVFPLHPEIAALKQRFYAQGAVYASMSGSGSSVFGIFRKAFAY